MLSPDELAAMLDGIPPWRIVGGSAALLVSAFCAYLAYSRGQQGGERRRAWVITLASSAVVSMAGLYFALKMIGADQYLDGLARDARHPHGASLFSDSDAKLARTLTLFFLAYLGVDSVCAALCYPGEIQIAYEHHAGYALLLGYLLLTERETLFALCAVEEIPTLIKAGFEVCGDVRPRLSIGLTIFVFRISWHLYATYVAIAHANAPLYFLSIGLLLQHIAWFRAWFFSRVSTVRALITTDCY